MALVIILGRVVCAVLAGARSFTAIAEWAADADEETRPGWGERAGAVGVHALPRPPAQPPTSDDHEVLTGFAQALPGLGS